MAQIYRIYVNDKRIIITSGSEKAYPLDCKKITEENLHSILTGMVNGYELANFVLFAKTPGKLIERLKKEVINIEAAGGLVRKDRNSTSLNSNNYCATRMQSSARNK